MEQAQEQDVINQFEGLLAAEQGQLDLDSKAENKTENNTETKDIEAQQSNQEDQIKDDEESEKSVEAEAEAEKPAEDTAESEEHIETLDELVEYLQTDADTLFNLKAKTKVNGEEKDVALRDLIKSYQLEGVVNKKSIELSNERKRLESEYADNQKAFAEMMTSLSGLEVELSTLVTQDNQINWAELRENDPIEYVRLKEDARERQDALDKVKAAKEYEKIQMQHEQEKQRKAILIEESRKLIDAIPDWKDDNIASKERTALQDYLANIGYSPEEVSNISDHRAVILSRKAMLYDQLQAGKTVAKKKVKTLPKVLKPGAATSKADVDNEKRATLMKKFQKTGSIDDMTALLLEG